MSPLSLEARIKEARKSFVNDFRYLEGMLKQAVKRA